MKIAKRVQKRATSLMHADLRVHKELTLFLSMMLNMKGHYLLSPLRPLQSKKGHGTGNHQQI